MRAECFWWQVFLLPSDLLTNGSRSVPRYGSISLRSVYESAASFISGVGSPTNYCAATRTGTALGFAAVVGAVSTNDDSTAAAGPVTASAFGPGTIRREERVSIWSYCIYDWVTRV